MRFADVIGQEKVKSQMIKSVKDNRVSHAQLLLGPGGSGSLPLAVAYAQYILCQDKQENDSCGVCSSCSKVSKLVHPDLHFSYPVISGGSKNPPVSNDFIQQWREAFLQNSYLILNDWMEAINGEGKNPNITANECRQIINKLNLKAFEGHSKVLLMWLPEYLGKEGNTLLKLIEEPPDNTVILMVAEDQEQILNTILSRTQLVKINRLGYQEITEALVEREGLQEQEAYALAQLADGSYNEAQRLLQDKVDDHAETFKKWMRFCLSNDRRGMVDWVDEVAKIGRENQRNLLKYGLHIMRECLIKLNMEEYQPRVQQSELELVNYLSRNLSFQQIKDVAQSFESGHYYVERNAYHKILFLNLSLKLQKIFAKQKLSGMEVAVI